MMPLELIGGMCSPTVGGGVRTKSERPSFLLSLEFVIYKSLVYITMYDDKSNINVWIFVVGPLSHVSIQLVPGAVFVQILP